MIILNNFRNKLLYCLFILIWVCLIAGINVNTSHFFLKESPSIPDILYFSRLYVQIILFFILIVFNLFFFKKIKFNFLFKSFILLNIVQIISLYYSKNSNLNIIFNIQTINTLLFLNLFSYFFPKRFFDLLFILLAFLSLIFLYFYFEYFYFFFEKNYLFYGHYNSQPFINIIHNPPRSSGMARLALVIFISILFFLNTKDNKKLNLIILLPFSIAIFLFQSRTILFIYFVIIFLLSFKLKFKLDNLVLNQFKFNLINFIVIPFLFFLIISSLQPKNLYQILKKFNLSDKSMVAEKEFTGEYRIIRKNNPSSFSSHRFEDWKKIIHKNKKYYLGHGTMGDRFLINQTASNCIIYLYSSSGIIGIVLFFFLIYKTLNMIIINKNYFQEQNNYNIKIIYSLYLFLIFILRSILENSFLIFGIDQIIFFIAIYYLILEFNFKKTYQPQ